MLEDVPDKPERQRTPKDDLWDCLAEHFGEPRTETEKNRFGKVVRELLVAGATPDETDNACSYVIRNFDSPSVFAVVAWFSQAQMTQTKLSPQEQMIEELRRKG